MSFPPCSKPGCDQTAGYLFLNHDDQTVVRYCPTHMALAIEFMLLTSNEVASLQIITNLNIRL